MEFQWYSSPDYTGLDMNQPLDELRGHFWYRIHEDNRLSGDTPNLETATSRQRSHLVPWETSSERRPPEVNHIGLPDPNAERLQRVFDI